MKQLMLLIIVTILALVSIGQDASLQVPSKNEALKLLGTYRFKVQVSVTCEEKNVKTLVESFIKRELRDLQDVDIVSLEPHHELVILLTEPIFKGTSTKMGHVIAAVNYLTLFYQEDMIVGATELPDISGPFGCSYPPALLIHTGNRNNLQDLCQIIIANFDTQILEKQRLFMNDLKSP